MEIGELGPSLRAAFARVPDVRSRHGRRYPLPALPTLATAAMLCGGRPMGAAAAGRGGVVQGSLSRHFGSHPAELRQPDVLRLGVISG